MSLQPRPWTNHEVEALLACHAKRMKPVRIALELDRSYEAVRSMIRRLAKPKAYRPPAEPVTNIETIAIPKSDVPQFYELGWRFAGFSKERLCVMVKERKL